MQKSYLAKPGEIEAKWWVVDAEGKVLGRIAREIAVRLMGKHKPSYTPHVESGDYVVVLNCDKVTLSGNKWKDKRYTWFTGYTRLRSATAEERRETAPERLIYEAVRRMLPKNKLAFKTIKRLKLYTGTEHPHQAQMPEKLEV
jgi:large subunit ribosomal protein L13